MPDNQGNRYPKKPGIFDEMSQTRCATLRLLTLLTSLRIGEPFRLLNAGVELHDGLAPYEVGLVGRVEDPKTTTPEHVNEGSISTRTHPRRWQSVPGRQVCPSMVGPLAMNRYFCHAKEYGYCDRRTGTCHCNSGYQGIDCSTCEPSHYRAGSLCYPKRLCQSAGGLGITSDCSGAGICNYTTGLCECQSQRTGGDCSIPKCATFDPLCTECTTQGCTRCAEGYRVDKMSLTCRGCAREYDPRCTSCDSRTCLQCTDRPLHSIHRSGRRVIDPELSQDDSRELSSDLRYNTQQLEYFDDSESFRLAPNVSLSEPLHERTTRCEQGRAGSPTWNCTKISDELKHVLCGHEGTFAWSSSSYAVAETAQTIRLAVRRTGGGVGSVSVRYAIRHITTDTSDLSPTAAYTLSTVLQFDAGVTELSFLLTVHDDRSFEGNEVAVAELTSPRGGATIGAQRRATITIVDDDSPHASAQHSRVVGASRGIAGTSSQTVVLAYSGTGIKMHTGGDIFDVNFEPLFFSFVSRGETKNRKYLRLPYASELSRFDTTIHDVGNGTYFGWWNGTKVGVYKQHTSVVALGGLCGEYYQNTKLWAKEAVVRTDAQINFRWEYGYLKVGDSPQIELGLDTNFVRWSGRLCPSYSEPYFLYVTTLGEGTGVRLWFDGRLVVDSWRARNYPEFGLKVPIHSKAGHLHSIVLELRLSRPAQGCFLGGRKRDLVGCNKGISLEWSSTSTSRTIISPDYLFLSRAFIDGHPAHLVKFLRTW